MQYIQATRNAKLQLEFFSNCYLGKDINFETNFEEDKDVNYDEPPAKVLLRLWNNYYVFSFSEPEELDVYDLYKTKIFNKVAIENVHVDPTLTT